MKALAEAYFKENALEVASPGIVEKTHLNWPHLDLNTADEKTMCIIWWPFNAKHLQKPF